MRSPVQEGFVTEYVDGRSRQFCLCDGQCCVLLQRCEIPHPSCCGGYSCCIWCGFGGDGAGDGGGIRQLIQTDLGVSITGIAGPDGGSAEKPVGLVYISVSDRRGTVVQKNYFRGTRLENKRAAVDKALAMIRDVLRSS